MKGRQVKYLIDKGAELIKFCFTVALICFLLIKAPSQAAQVVSVAGAFLLGASNAKVKLGL